LGALSDVNFSLVFIDFLVLLFSLTVHESAHAAAADSLGDPTARLLGRISLNPAVHVDPLGTIVLPLVAAVTGAPLIGWAKPVPVNANRLRRGRRDFLLVAAAGPASNLVLGVIAAVALRMLPVSPLTLDEMNVSAPLAVFCRTALEINLLLAVFNMIPIPPLDGGNVLAGLLPESLADVFDKVRPFGFVALYALLLTGALSQLIWPPAMFLLELLLP
jgi:Zn-dependent protease